MSTSDQQGKGPLTRKQLREIRLTGATPVISAEDAAAALAPAPVPTSPLPRPAEPVDVPEAPVADETVDLGSMPLTRRQAREQERIRTASVPVIAPEHDEATDAETVEEAQVEEAQVEEAGVEELEVVEVEAIEDEAVAGDEGDAEAVDAEADAATDEIEEERPVVSPTFGQGLLSDSEQPAFTPSFDDLLTVNDSTGSQHIAPSALIFNPSPGERSLSGPVASTGEILVTGSYDLPHGLGSQGHAHGTTDGKEIDSVLIDGELPAASSPTPIAASSAVSTSKPAGEVIRPPAPEKGNRLMMTLAITAGGLALALAVALIVAFTTNVF